MYTYTKGTESNCLRRNLHDGQMTKILSLLTCISGITLVRVTLSEAHIAYLLGSNWPHSTAVFAGFPMVLASPKHLGLLG